ncbi:endonuclease/exonuclease/phosphatase family protein [Pseudaestuariivita sp.]|uniref:endonuclease/exonuclease/phosphatase family protein n=1 Tax=Pseudaestuariivita sp. TaxID=2211669 RepID=UPI004059EFC8
MRLATWHAPLERDGPGLLLKDIRKGEAAETVQTIAALEADILLLTKVDYDLDLLALTALRDAIDGAGWRFDHIFALSPNTGQPTGFDLDRNGKLGEARDAQGFGAFRGQGGPALLSRHPIDRAAVQDFSQMLWKDAPESRIPRDYYTDAEAEVLRLSHGAHWIVPIRVRDQTLNVLAFAASPIAFDGPEDRNGKRNADELDLWRHVLDGRVGKAAHLTPFALIGLAYIDPNDSDGDTSAIRALLADPRLQDPRPRGPGGTVHAEAYHTGDPALDTTDYREAEPGNLRLSYILPSADLTVTGARVVWPSDAPAAEATTHYPVWVDIDF